MKYVVNEQMQSAAASGHRCVAQRPHCARNGHPLGGRSGHRERLPAAVFASGSDGGFRSNQNGKVFRCPFQNGVGRDLIVQNHSAPAFWITL